MSEEAGEKAEGTTHSSKRAGDRKATLGELRSGAEATAAAAAAAAAGADFGAGGDTDADSDARPVPPPSSFSKLAPGRQPVLGRLARGSQHQSVSDQMQQLSKNGHHHQQQQQQQQQHVGSQQGLDDEKVVGGVSRPGLLYKSFRTGGPSVASNSHPHSHQQPDCSTGSHGLAKKAAVQGGAAGLGGGGKGGGGGGRLGGGLGLSKLRGKENGAQAVCSSGGGGGVDGRVPGSGMDGSEGRGGWVGMEREEGGCPGVEEKGGVSVEEAEADTRMRGILKARSSQGRGFKVPRFMNGSKH